MPPRSRGGVRRARLATAALAALAASAPACASASAADAFAGWWHSRGNGSSLVSLPDWAAPRQPGELPLCSFHAPPGAHDERAAHDAAAAPPRRIRSLCVVGERHSGTNFVSSLLDANFAQLEDADADDAAADVADDSQTTPLVAHARFYDPLSRLPPRPGRVGHGCALQRGRRRRAAHELRCAGD
jgi:hypothetical protein